MREMKDSGIEWIGQIPKEWNLGRIKYYSEVTLGKMLQNEPKGNFDTNEYYLCAANIGSFTLNLNSIKKMWFSKAEKNKLNLSKGDLLVIEGGDVGSCVYLEKDLPNIYFQNSINRVKSNYKLDIRLIKYILFLAKKVGYIDLICNKATISHLTKEKLEEIFCIVPENEEQQQIADFLDTKCFEIDATAEDIQKEISLLEDYKKSVITEAVTKGLNPDAEMKDSGIEWIGDINRKASLCRLKFFSYMKGRIGWQGLKSEDFIDNGPYCVTGTDFINGKINWDTCYHVSEERYKMDSNIQLKIGDLLVTKDGTIGKLAKVTELPEKACLNSHLLIIRPLNERFTNEYLYYVISSDVFVRYYKYSSTGSTMESLSQEKLGNFIFPVYDLLSQQQIVDYLDSKCSEIETLIADKKRQLDILADYKKYLIYEYVTGKKEVPVKDF